MWRFISSWKWLFLQLLLTSCQPLNLNHHVNIPPQLQCFPPHMAMVFKLAAFSHTFKNFHSLIFTHYSSFERRKRVIFDALFYWFWLFSLKSYCFLWFQFSSLSSYCLHLFFLLFFTPLLDQFYLWKCFKSFIIYFVSFYYQLFLNCFDYNIFTLFDWIWQAEQQQDECFNCFEFSLHIECHCFRQQI